MVINRWTISLRGVERTAADLVCWCGRGGWNRDGEGVTSLADEVTTFLRNYFHYFLNLAVTPWNGVAWELLRCATESLFYSLPVF